GSRVWRVWQGTASSICLVERSGKPAVRRLVVVPQAKMGSVEILRHEDLLNMLDVGRERPCGGS
ncbi:MAG: hypothetical protein GY856_32475, partial [bacterium]|nr:hypothetical protein [bacterium]